MVRPELHHVPRPYMDSTAYKQAVREAHEAAQPIERRQVSDRAMRRMSGEAERLARKRSAA